MVVLPTPPADILAAALTLLSRVHQRKVAVKPKLKGLAGCSNYRGNELAQYSVKYEITA